jgi:transposase
MGGQPAKQVAQQVGRSRGTVEDWVRRFKAHGLAGLHPTFRGQPGTRLTPPERAQLQAMVQRPPRQVGLKTGTGTGMVVAAFVTRACGTTLSAATARRERHRRGFGRTRCVRATPAAQRAFAQALPQVEQPREPGRVTVDRDQGPIWPEALPRLGWCLRGQPAESESTSPGKAAQRLCSVAVGRPSGRVSTRLCDWCSQEATVRFLAKLRRCLGRQRIALVWDNAPQHQGPRVQQALVQCRLKSPPRPPYRPEMHAAAAWIRGVKEALSANICWQERGALLRSFMGCVASMTKRVDTVLHRCVPQMYGSSCA